MAVDDDPDQKRDEDLMGDLIGFEEEDKTINYAKKFKFGELPPDKLLVKVFEQTLEVYSSSEKQDAKEIISLIQAEDLNKFKQDYIEPMSTTLPPQLYSTRFIDLGLYPPSPWLDDLCLFKSKIDEITRGSTFLEGTYDLEQKEGTDMTIKKFYNQFEAP